jgi:hypothetical protein
MVLVVVMHLPLICLNRKKMYMNYLLMFVIDALVDIIAEANMIYDVIEPFKTYEA